MKELIQEVIKARNLYYSIKSDDDSFFNINLEGINNLTEQDLLELLKLLNMLIKEELDKY